MGGFVSQLQLSRPDEESQANTADASNTHGLYFGPHFVMGGQRFGAAPDSFLFGGLNNDFSTLNAFGLNRVGQPTPEMHTTTTIRNHVNLKRGSLKFEHVPELNPVKYRLSFTFDSDTPCSIQFFIACTESLDESHNAIYTSKLPEGASDIYKFPKGMGQTFSLPDSALINLSRFAPEDLQVDHERHTRGVYPIVIHMIALTDDAVDSVKDDHQSGPVVPVKNETSQVQSQSTLASFVPHADSDLFDLRVLKQKIMVQGVSYLLQEIYGTENSNDSTDETDDGVENTRECVVCMSDPKDTTVLPCRHMCLCSQCAEQLRYQSNKCPICRQPFHSLLQIKIGEDKPKAPEESVSVAVGVDSQAIDLDDDNDATAVGAANISQPAPSSTDVFQMAAQTGQAQLVAVSAHAIANAPPVNPTSNYLPLTSFAPRAPRASLEKPVKKTTAKTHVIVDDEDDQETSGEERYSADELSADELDQYGTTSAHDLIPDPLGASSLKSSDKPKKKKKKDTTEETSKKPKKTSKGKEKASIDNDGAIKKKPKTSSADEASSSSTPKPLKKKTGKKRVSEDSAGTNELGTVASRNNDGTTTAVSFVNPLNELADAD